MIIDKKMVLMILLAMLVIMTVMMMTPATTMRVVMIMTTQWSTMAMITMTNMTTFPLVISHPLTKGERLRHDGVDEAPGEGEEDAQAQVVVLRAGLVGARAHRQGPHEHHRPIVVHHIAVRVGHRHGLRGGLLHTRGQHEQQQHC